MKSGILLAALAMAAFSSCTSTYKSSQTPDDVYYSPIREVKHEEQRRDDSQDQAKKAQETEDREIRNRIRDRRYRDFDDDYSYDYNYNTRCNCYCDHSGYGYYNHPYYVPRYYYSPKYTPLPVNTTPRMVNLGAYTPVKTPAVVTKTGTTTRQPTYNNSNSGLGNTMRRIFAPSQSSNNSNNNNSSSSSSGNNNTRTYQPSTPSSNSGSSSSSSSSSSNSGTVSRPVRGGK